MLAVAEAIAAIAQTPGKGAALSPWKIVKSSLFETDIYCMYPATFGHMTLKM